MTDGDVGTRGRSLKPVPSQGRWFEPSSVSARTHVTTVEIGDTVREMSEFLKSWKFMALVIGLLSATAIAGVVYGVVMHEEAGFMDVTPGWEPRDFPLRVRADSYSQVEGTGATAEHLAGVTDDINMRLGFSAFRPAYGMGDADILVVYEAPSEPSWQDPGGTAIIGHGSCEIHLSNVTGELRSLTLQHELGHCLGLAHDQEQTSIMRPTQAPTADGQYPPRISDHDRTLLRETFATDGDTYR